MQSHADLTDEHGLVPPSDDHDQVSDTYVLRRTADGDNAEEHCYFCFEDWQTGHSMVRLRCCNHWLHEGCLSKSVLDGRCPTCGIWLALLDAAQVLVGAASMGDILKVRELLGNHTSYTALDYFGRTPLHLAVLGGHEEVVKELLDHGVDTSAVDYKGQTALHLAAQRYSPEILPLLLEKGADIAARDSENMTPLHFAYQSGFPKMVDILLEKGAKRDAKAKHGITPEILHPFSAHSESLSLLSRYR